MPTKEQIKIPMMITFQGIKNPVSKKEPTIFPTVTPKIIPITAPIKLIKMDSNKNC